MIDYTKKKKKIKTEGLEIFVKFVGVLMVDISHFNFSRCITVLVFGCKDNRCLHWCRGRFFVNGFGEGYHGEIRVVYVRRVEGSGIYGCE